MILRRFPSLIFQAFLCVVAIAGSTQLAAQRIPFDRAPQGDIPVDPDGAEFHFARLIYRDGNGRGFGNRSWTTDMPDAEHFFMEGLLRLTRVDGTPVSLYSGAGGERINLLDGN